jgi:glycerol kinase
MLPAICNNSGFIGKIRRLPEIPSELWDIPICSCIGDQQSALFGQTCFSCGDVKNTYGTGCFTLMNIGDTPVYDDHLITTVGWKTDKVLVYALEGSVFNAGSSIQWLRDELHIISQARECDLLAESIPDSQGVTFVSSFTGLGAPYWDMYARGTLVGLTRGTGRAQICRAVLEGIAFQVYDLIHAMEIGAKKSVGYLKVDGGASVSDFMMQFQADLLGVPVDRPQNVESTALGAAMLAFIGIGAFQIEDLRQIRKSEKIYKPSMSQTMRLENLTRWQKAVRAVKEFEL